VLKNKDKDLEYLIDYGLFLAKAATIVIALMLIIGALASAGGRQRRAPKRGEIVVESLNDHLEDLRDSLRVEILDKTALKLEQKQRAREEKQEEKEAKQRAKAAARMNKKAQLKSANTSPNEQESAGDERRKRVYVLDFEGDVEAEGVDSLREEITAVLALAECRDEVIVRLESPGGMVHAYGLAASQLQRIKDARVPLTICVDRVAASGGYMMACLADRIVAAPFAIIGSIGVVIQLPNFHKILKKNEVDYEVISAGEYKRTLSTFGEITEKGRAKVQEDVEAIHGIFKQWVKSHRPSVDIDAVATGETWVGMQAQQRYLVDDLSTSDEVLVAVCQDADVYEVSYKIKQSLQERFSAVVEASFSRAVAKLIAADRTKNFQ
jgi:serine protease SohB